MALNEAEENALLNAFVHPVRYQPPNPVISTRTLNIVLEMRRILGAYAPDHIEALLSAMVQYTAPGEAWTRADLEKLQTELGDI